jgi:hypothetical protein
MAGIAALTVLQFHEHVRRFDPRYVAHWDSWLDVADRDKPELFGFILRAWNACRPNTMRRTRAEQLHDAPYIEELIAASSPHVEALADFRISQAASFTVGAKNSLHRLWETLRQLSHSGRAREGVAGAVGISKAVLLLTNGRVGPAFDSQVRGRLGIRKIDNAEQWLTALEAVTVDIGAFEANNGCRFEESFPPEHHHLLAGRVYDMALGPGL